MQGNIGNSCCKKINCPNQFADLLTNSQRPSR
jgi:hypothetical protein